MGVGGRQNVSSPFQNMELVTSKPLLKAHTVVADVARLEPDCLYVAVVDSQYRCPRMVLRCFCAQPMKFRELSAPESSHFLQAQANAFTDVDNDSFSSHGSAEFPRQRDCHPDVNIDSLPETDSKDNPLEGLHFDCGGGDSIPLSKLLKSAIALCQRTLQC